MLTQKLLKQGYFAHKMKSLLRKLNYTVVITIWQHCQRLIRSKNCLPLASAVFTPVWGGPCCSVVLVFLCWFYVYCMNVFVLCLVHTMLPVSLDCSLLIVPSGFSNVYSGWEQVQQYIETATRKYGEDEQCSLL